ncbi:hypothetical protein [Burkholderia pyrrocinia]|nr:hypothetical protein [Burkholderia pyrrocinia]
MNVSDARPRPSRRTMMFVDRRPAPGRAAGARYRGTVDRQSIWKTFFKA